MRRSWRLTAVAAFAVAGTLLAGCGEEPLPSPSPRPTTETVPVINADQATRVLERVAPGVTAADNAKDAAQLPPVADGPALAARTAGYVLSTRDPALPMPRPIGAERLSLVVPARQEWPRTVLTVTRANPDDTVPQVLLLTQAGAREPYKLTAYAPMIARASFPVMAAPRDGTDVIAPDDGEGLMMSPQDAVNSYAAYLTEGSGSAHKDKFTASPMTDAVFTMQDQSREMLAGPTCPDCFGQTIARTPNPAHLWAFRTLDGGAFVFAQIDSSTVITSNGGAQLALHQELRAISGVPVLSTTGTFGYQETVGLLIPPAGPNATISPVAFDRVAVSATIS